MCNKKQRKKTKKKKNKERKNKNKRIEALDTYEILILHPGICHRNENENVLLGKVCFRLVF